MDVSDFIDARPRVADYNTSSTTSPFDYDTRSFTVSGTKPPVIVGDIVTVGYSHYLARIDKIYLTKDGFFEVEKKEDPGIPVSDVVPPTDQLVHLVLEPTVSIDPYVEDTKK